MNNRMKRRVQNRVVICVDNVINDDLMGRLFTQYSYDSIEIMNTMQMIKEMENMYDQINFPQSSVRMREFGKNKKQNTNTEKAKQIRSSSEIMEFKGERATFAVDVTSRQNATWQGVIYWAEEDILKEFSSLMDMLVLIDNAIK